MNHLQPAKPSLAATYRQHAAMINAPQISSGDRQLSSKQPSRIKNDNSAVTTATAETGNNDNNLLLNQQPAAEQPRIDQEHIVAGNTIAGTQAEAAGNDPADHHSADTTQTKAAAADSRQLQVKPRRVVREKGVYAGLLAAWDFSTVKWQRINKTGYSFTLLAGYRFTNRLSVESGIAWNNKQYYTTGDYFDKSRTGISPESKIIYANGGCTMFEIPINARYDVVSRPKSNLFLTAGVSSYIMKDESYSYYAEHNGWYYDADKSYRNSGANWLKVANLSIGFQHSLSRHMDLRIEPYAKLPLNGLGIAKLPILSTGISAGITRKL